MRFEHSSSGPGYFSLCLAEIKKLEVQTSALTTDPVSVSVTKMELVEATAEPEETFIVESGWFFCCCFLSFLYFYWVIYWSFQCFLYSVY